MLAFNHSIGATHLSNRCHPPFGFFRMDETAMPRGRHTIGARDFLMVGIGSAGVLPKGRWRPLGKPPFFESDFRKVFRALFPDAIDLASPTLVPLFSRRIDWRAMDRRTPRTLDHLRA